MHQYFHKFSLSLVFLVIACSEDKQPRTEQVKVIADEKINSSDARSDIASIESSKSQRQNLDALARKKIMVDVNSSLEPLSHGLDPISNFKKEWGKFNHPFLSKSLTSEEFAEFFRTPQKSLREQLIDPNDKWNNDEGLRRAAVGRSALMVSIIGSDGSEVPRFPELITDMDQSRDVNEGDLLFLKCATQAMSMIEVRPKLSDSDLPAWIRLAKSPNPAYRAVALIVFVAMQSTPVHQKAFYGVYSAESDFSVGKMYMELIEAADATTAISLITQFKSRSPVASQLEELIDQNLFKLKK